MPMHMKVVFRNIALRSVLGDYIRKKIKALEKINNRIICCHVTIEKPQESRQAGGLHRIILDITLPRRQEIVVKKELKISGRYNNLAMLINNAFKIAIWQLEDLKDRQSGHAKARPKQQLPFLHAS